MRGEERRAREGTWDAHGFPVSGRTRCDGSMASAVRRTRGDHQMIRFLFVLAALASGTGALLFPARAAHAQDMINNLTDYTGTWLLAALMQQRGMAPGEESRKAAKEERKRE